MPRSKSFCASGSHDVSKCTLPSLLSSVCPRAADRASEAPDTAMAATANDVLFMILLLVGIETERGAVIAWSEWARSAGLVARKACRLDQSVLGGAFKSLRYATLAKRV